MENKTYWHGGNYHILSVNEERSLVNSKSALILAFHSSLNPVSGFFNSRWKKQQWELHFLWVLSGGNISTNQFPKLNHSLSNHHTVTVFLQFAKTLLKVREIWDKRGDRKQGMKYLDEQPFILTVIRRMERAETTLFFFSFCPLKMHPSLLLGRLYNELQSHIYHLSKHHHSAFLTFYIMTQLRNLLHPIAEKAYRYFMHCKTSLMCLQYALKHLHHPLMFANQLLQTTCRGKHPSFMECTCKIRFLTNFCSVHRCSRCAANE